MSRINRFRLINIEYNHNGMMIPDHKYILNGKSALFLMENGSGKSVIMQMLQSMFVSKHNRDLNGRKFSSFFTTRKPSIIMTEFILDNNRDRLLVGSIVCKSNNKEKVLDIINFLCSYGPDEYPYDIFNIPLGEAEGDIFYVKSLQEGIDYFESLKQTKDVEFSFYDMTSSYNATKYYDELKTYDIDKNEWDKILHPLNDGESRLGELFADSTTAGKLLCNWLIPKAVAKRNLMAISKDQNLVKSISNYIDAEARNSEKIAGLAALRRFNEGSAPKLQALATEAEALFAKKSTSFLYLCVLNASISKILDQLSLKKEELNQKFDEITNQEHRIDQEELSFKYYEAETGKHEKEESKKEIDAAIIKLEEKQKANTRRKNILRCAEQQSQINSIKEELDTALADKEALEKKDADNLPTINYLGYLLKTHYEQELTKLKEKKSQIEAELQQQKESHKKAQKNAHDFEEAAHEEDKQIGILKRNSEEFIDIETTYNKKYNQEFHLLNSLIHEYPPEQIQQRTESLKIGLQTAKDNLTFQQQSETTTAKELDECQKSLITLRSKKEATRERLTELKHQQKAQEKDLSVRSEAVQILSAWTSDELDPFNKDYILSLLRSNNIRIKEELENLTTEMHDLELEISTLKSKKGMKLEKEFEVYLKGLGITPQFGSKWLQDKDISEKEKQEYIEKLPILPGSLIMTAAEFNKLQSSNHPVYTKAPVFIILYEDLKKYLHGTNDFSMCDGIEYYYRFDKTLLNPEKLKAEIVAKEERHEKLANTKNNRDREKDTLVTITKKIEADTLTKEAYNQTIGDISSSNEEEGELQSSIASAEAREKELHKKQADLIKEVQQASGAINSIEREQQAFDTFIARYNQEKEDYAATLCHEKKFDELTKAADKAKEEADRLFNDIETTKGRAQETDNEIKIVTSKASPFSNYPRTYRPDGVEDYTCDILSALTKHRALTRENTKSIEELNSTIQDKTDKLTDAKKILSDKADTYGLIENDWKDETYSNTEEKALEKEAQVLTKAKEELYENQGAINSDIAHYEKELAALTNDLNEFPSPYNQIILSEALKEKDYAASRRYLNEAREQTTLNLKQIEADEKEFNGQQKRLKNYESPYGISSNENELLGYPETTPQKIKSLISSAIEAHSSATNNLGNKKTAIQQALAELAGDARKNESIAMVVERLSDTEKKDEYPGFSNYLQTTTATFSRMIDLFTSQLSQLAETKEFLIDEIMDYVHAIHKEINKMDDLKIPLDGQQQKVLVIKQPDWTSNEPTFKNKITNLVDILIQRNKSLWDADFTHRDDIENSIAKATAPTQLYKHIINIERDLSIKVRKFERNSTMLVDWSKCIEESGAEKTLCAGIILLSLMHYMRSRPTDFHSANQGPSSSILPMDNPFGPIQSEHLLEPFFTLCELSNTQLIAFTGIDDPVIKRMFDTIYKNVLIQPAPGKSYLATETLKLAPIQIQIEEVAEQGDLFGENL